WAAFALFKPVADQTASGTFFLRLLSIFIFLVADDTVGRTVHFQVVVDLLGRSPRGRRFSHGLGGHVGGRRLKELLSLWAANLLSGWDGQVALQNGFATGASVFRHGEPRCRSLAVTQDIILRCYPTPRVFARR